MRDQVATLMPTIAAIELMMIIAMFIYQSSEGRYYGKPTEKPHQAAKRD